MKEPALLAEVRRFCEAGKPPCGIVVAVSGGPDSTALLHALIAVRQGSTPPLVIAHLNHMLRGDESDADEQFVRQMHATLSSSRGSIDLRCERIDIGKQAEIEGANRESIARRERYAWLGRVALETGADQVATGHTADDQAETVLHRLLRGTGMQGLRGIAARRPLVEGVELVRPMLHVRRTDVLAFLEQGGLPFRQDSSNFDIALTRNRIRHELLPLLVKDYNPAIVRILGQLAEQAEEMHGTLSQLAEKLLADAELPRAAGRLIFHRDRLSAAPRHLIRAALRFAWAREGWPQGEMRFSDWDRLAAVVQGEIVAVDLPGGITARMQGRVVQLGRV